MRIKSLTSDIYCVITSGSKIASPTFLSVKSQVFSTSKMRIKANAIVAYRMAVRKKFFLSVLEIPWWDLFKFK